MVRYLNNKRFEASKTGNKKLAPNILKRTVEDKPPDINTESKLIRQEQLKTSLTNQK